MILHIFGVIIFIVVHTREADGRHAKIENVITKDTARDRLESQRGDARLFNRISVRFVVSRRA